MITIYFSTLVALYSCIGVVFLRNFLVRRQPASLVVWFISLLCVAWFLREMHWLPHLVSVFLIAAAGPVGALGLLICINAERQH